MFTRCFPQTVDACNKFDQYVNDESTDEQDKRDYLIHFNIELAKCLIQDLDYKNAKQVASTILAYVNNDPSW